MGDEVALVALLLTAHGTGGGTPAIAALLLAGAVPTVVLAPWAGRLVDRVDSRRLLAVTGSVQAALCVALAASEPFPAVLVLVAALSATQAVAGPAWQALTRTSSVSTRCRACSVPSSPPPCWPG